MRYQFIKQQQGAFSIAAVCRVLAVSESGYYAWCKRAKSRREQDNARLLEQVRSVYQDSDHTYGSPRIYQQLKEVGFACSQNRIARLMRQAGISAQAPKRFALSTQADASLLVAENILARQFEAPRPNTRWSGDLTYVWTGQGWLYLAVILDLFSRRVVGWAMGSRPDRFLVVSALEMALCARAPASGLVCHSDRGSQYQSGDYQEALKQATAVCSMSRRGNCFDNAPVESFFASLKRELVHRVHFATRQQARTAIFWWIEVWYNRKRRHSALSYLSPEAFERQYHQQQEPMAA